MQLGPAAPHNRARVVLVGCSSAKLDRPAPARALYLSPLFTLARELAERWGTDWRILSGEHGAVHPDQELAPYDFTLRDATPQRQLRYAFRLQQQLRADWPNPDAVVFIILAGELYAPSETFSRAGWRPVVARPLRGMGIGERLAWLRRQLSNPALPGPQLELY